MYIIDNPTSDYLATKEWINKYNIARGDKVFTIGLVPSLYSKNERNLVLSRFGNISLLSQKELDLPRGNRKFILWTVLHLVEIAEDQFMCF